MMTSTRANRSAGISVAFVLSTVALSGCGDALISDDGRGDPLFSVQGRAVDLEEGLIETEPAVAFLFMHVVTPGRFGTPENTYTANFELIFGQVRGSVPTRFAASLQERPQAYPFDNNVVYLNLDGSAAPGVFSADNAPEAVRVANLVIGPLDELLGLPATVALEPDESGVLRNTLGRKLSELLPRSTISPYQVVYAEGVGDENMIYPERNSRDPSRLQGGLPVSEGFTFLDTRRYMASTMWQVCANRVVSKHASAPGVKACAGSSLRQGCYQACPGIDRDELSTCRAGCDREYPNEPTANDCLRNAASSELLEICGPEATPSADQVFLLASSDADISVTVGVDDVKEALWILHLVIEN